MPFFKWNEKYSVGILSIDKQHVRLVQILNAMFDAMKAGKGNDVIGKVLDELSKYTIVHFQYEEELFNKYQYPGKNVHKSEHQILLKQIQEFKEQFDSGKTALSTRLFEFLKSWLINHIEKSDMQYSSFLRQKGVK